MFEMLFALALLTVGDPPGDAMGDGSLQAPTASVYRTLSPFDIQSVTVEDAERLTVVIEMGSLANPFDLPLGFSMPVIEVYLEGAAGTGIELLPGSGMRLADGRSWETAIRLTGEEARGYRSTAAGLETVPAEVVVDGSQMVVTLPFDSPERRPRIYAISGLYDLFGSTPWRPLSQVESPWAFSSTGSQRVPVVDVLAADAAAQRQALDSGVIPPAGGRRLADGSFWLILMGLGLSLALVGISLRVLARNSPDRAGRLATSHEPSAPANTTRDAPYAASDAMDEESARRTSVVDAGDGKSAKRRPAVWSDANLASTDHFDGNDLGAPNDEQTEADDWLGASTTAAAGPDRLPAFAAPDSRSDVEGEDRDGSGKSAGPGSRDEIQEPQTERNEEIERRDESEQRPESEREDDAELEDESERKELKRFLWDSSALLTDLDDALATGEDELAGEFERAGSEANRFRARRDDSNRAVWNRPIPLPYEENPSGREEESDEAVLLTDDEEGSAETRSDPERDSRGERD